MSTAARRRRFEAATVTAKSKRDSVVAQRRSILSRVGDDPKMTRVVAKNIGETVSAVEVRTLFSQVGGKVKRVNAILGESGTGTYEIDFYDASSARAALSLDQRTVDGRRISVSLASEDKKQPTRLLSKALEKIKNAPVKTTPRKQPEPVVVDLSKAFGQDQAEKKKKKKKKNATAVRSSPKSTPPNKSTRNKKKKTVQIITAL